MSLNKHYEDIINYLHHVSRKRKPMSMESRAAQFAPFAALSGHDDTIAETGRQTTSRIELSADEMQALSQKLSYAQTLAEPPLLSITYFRPDSRKSGGAYITVQGRIKKIESCFNLLTLTDGTEIPLDAISDISGQQIEILS
ncbi:MAG: hypothetical protein NC338_08655 [Firmicutes bacterium]|nr:hypothetical protein [Bacillota bacterium]